MLKEISQQKEIIREDEKNYDIFFSLPEIITEIFSKYFVRF